MSKTIKLLPMERKELSQRTSRQSGRADEARRARLILLLDAGHTWAWIREKLDCRDSFIAGISGLGQNVWPGCSVATRGSYRPRSGAAGGAHSGVERKAQTLRRLDPLEHSQARCPLGRQPHDGGASVAQACIATASA